MDGHRFDTLTRRLAAGTSRRTLLKGMVSGLVGGLAGLGGTRAPTAGAQATGTPCTRATDCASFFCVDGVCCDTPCSGQCEACSTGTCTPVSGPPLGGRPVCPGSGECTASCDGHTTSHCANWPGPETPCGGDSTCDNGWRTTYACAGNGSCAPTTTPCADGCDSDADCTRDPTACEGVATCEEGTCICQSCGFEDRPCCPPDDTCIEGRCADGTCRFCGLETFPCCPPDNTCADDLGCDAATGTCEHCGFVFEPCCPPDNTCVGGPLRFCDESGTCQPCGLEFARCCPPDDTCLEDFTFCDAASGTCQSCGDTGEPCCQPGNTCGDGQTCCTGQCIDTQTDPTNCGGCGVHCRLNETCSGGECVCPGSNVRHCSTGFTCCPERGVCSCTSTTPGTGPQFLDATCNVVSQCPAGTSPCVGATNTCPLEGERPSQVCCPDGTTCDPETGTCLQ